MQYILYISLTQKIHIKYQSYPKDTEGIYVIVFHFECLGTHKIERDQAFSHRDRRVRITLGVKISPTVS